MGHVRDVSDGSQANSPTCSRRLTLYNLVRRSREEGLLIYHFYIPDQHGMETFLFVGLSFEITNAMLQLRTSSG